MRKKTAMTLIAIMLIFAFMLAGCANGDDGINDGVNDNPSITEDLDDNSLGDDPLADGNEKMDGSSTNDVDKDHDKSNNPMQDKDAAKDDKTKDRTQ